MLVFVVPEFQLPRKNTVRPFRPVATLTDHATQLTLERMSLNLGTLCWDSAHALSQRDAQLRDVIQHRWVASFASAEHNQLRRGAEAAFWDGAYIAYHAYTMPAAERQPPTLGWFLDEAPSSPARRHFDTVHQLDVDKLADCFRLAQVEVPARRALTLGATERYNSLHRQSSEQWPPSLRPTTEFYLQLGIGAIAFVAAYGQHFAGDVGAN
jgi:hypothetical protein